jgi:LuxR family maltose regulon positive regulatory protein
VILQLWGGWAAEVVPRPTGIAGLVETLALAKAHLALGQPDRAQEAVAALLEVAREKKLDGWMVEALAVQALVAYAQSRKTQALSALAEAVTLAEPEGYVRSFVDLGRGMAALLKQASIEGIAPDYVAGLLSAFGLSDDAAPPRRTQPLIEPLSPRELEVLSLVAQGMSNREVGRHLHVAESTVKSHLNSVFGKLGVRNRVQATAKARSLNLL